MIDLLINITYVITIPTFFLAGTVGVCYCLNPDKTKEFIAKKSWEASKLYVWTKNEYDTLINSDANDGYHADKEYPEYDITYNNLLFLDNKGNACVCDTSNSETVANIIKLKPNPIFLEKKNNEEILYKRIVLDSEKKLDEFDFTKSIEDPFIQVEYIDDDIILNLHDKLKMFYLIDNEILDKEFVRFIIKYYFDREISDTYTIRIFDKDVNQIELKKNRFVVITNKNEKNYEIKDAKNINNNSDNIFTDSESDGSNSQPLDNPLEF